MYISPVIYTFLVFTILLTVTNTNVEDKDIALNVGEQGGVLAATLQGNLVLSLIVDYKPMLLYAGMKSTITGN
jgi:hypothetical protein